MEITSENKEIYNKIYSSFANVVKDYLNSPEIKNMPFGEFEYDCLLSVIEDFKETAYRKSLGKLH